MAAVDFHARLHQRQREPEEAVDCPVFERSIPGWMGMDGQGVHRALLEQQATWNRGHVCSFNSVTQCLLNVYAK